MPTLTFWAAYLFLCFAIGLIFRDGLDSWLWLLVISMACLLASCFIPEEKDSDDAPSA